MINLTPLNQTKLYGLDKYFLELKKLYDIKKFPNKILLSGLKGLGKSTLAYHFINYVLTLDEEKNYDVKNFIINIESPQFKTIVNKSNTNFINVDVNIDKKFIDINQIRDLLSKLNKSTFNTKPRFILIDNIELLNLSSINALLKILEEPNENVYFILIHNNRKVLSTLLSRCINYKISLSNKECFNISDKLLDNELKNLVNKDIINYYFTPGEIYYLYKFSNENNYDLLNTDLKTFLIFLIDNNYYKKNQFINSIMHNLIEFYFRKLSLSFSKIVSEKYSYFLKRFNQTKTYNLDQESLFMEFKDEILNG